MFNNNDPLLQVGRNLRRTKENAEAALRRAYPIIPKIERTRDVFDPVQPFEMHFTTDHEGLSVGVDFVFNKPPPMCALFEFKKCCQEFIEGAGEHLLQLLNPYQPGQVQIIINGFNYTLFEETDPANGIIYIFGLTSTTQFINVCYLRADL